MEWWAVAVIAAGFVWAYDIRVPQRTTLSRVHRGYHA
jgi:hypothetical protein